ncbi:MAG: hypothetical protein ACXW3C_02890 [Pyrinomonadaceae bacterium]
MKTLFVFATVMVVLFLVLPNKIEAQKPDRVSRLEARVAELERRLAEVESKLAKGTTAGAAQAQRGRQPSAPSESAGRRFLESNGDRLQTVRRQSDPFLFGFTVESFTKTNGIDRGLHYTMEYRAQVKCEKLVQPKVVSYIRVFCTRVGQVVNLSDTIEFEKTDNGWRAPDGKIY